VLFRQPTDVVETFFRAYLTFFGAYCRFELFSEKKATQPTDDDEKGIITSSTEAVGRQLFLFVHKIFTSKGK
jgi:hypothetical protein